MDVESIIQRRMSNTGETKEQATAAVEALLNPSGPDEDWWLSFADASGFLGACIVSAASIAQAAQVAHRFGCNPGGEVAGRVIPKDVATLIEGKWRQKLLTREECEIIAAIQPGRETKS